MKYKLIAGLYFVTGVLFITGDAAVPGIPGIILKSLLIPILALYFILNSEGKKDKLFFILIAGLFFSWAGDVLLEYKSPSVSLFLPGLASFLMARIMYIILFFSTPGKNMSLIRFLFFTGLLSVYGATLFSIISEYLGGMRFPVMIYAFTILLMLLGALNRINKVNRKSYILTVCGAFLFVLSDSLLAINRFGYDFSFSGPAVMSTYLAAQFLIVEGILKEKSAD